MQWRLFKSDLALRELMLPLSVLTSIVILLKYVGLCVWVCVLPLLNEMGDYLSSLTFSLIGWFGLCLCSFQEQRSPWNDCWLPIVSSKTSLLPMAADNPQTHIWKCTHPSRGAKTHTPASAVARETRKWHILVVNVTQGYIKRWFFCRVWCLLLSLRS